MFLSYIKNQGITDDIALNSAQHIDILTFNRIDYDTLSDYQKDIITRCHSKLCAFEKDNQDLLNSVFSSYSVNGVSMTFGNSPNIKYVNGVVIPKDLYAMLCSTGLCYPVLR